MTTSENHLSNLLFSHDGKTIDKWEQYLAIYANELAPFVQRQQPVRLLEIGVQNGGSLELWSKYLPAGSEITGIDIDTKVGPLQFDGQITTHVVDATNRSKIDEALAAQQFDIIIDDGSHACRDIIAAFKSLFGRLRPGGKFIIEDLHASYWRSHGGGFRTEASAVEFFKDLVDALNIDHLEHAASLPQDKIAELRTYGRTLARITFYDSIAVVEKLTQPKMAPYRRIIAGNTSDVVDPFDGMMKSSLVAISRLIFSDHQKRQLEPKMLARLESLTTELVQLNAAFATLTAENVQLKATVAMPNALLASPLGCLRGALGALRRRLTRPLKRRA